MAEAAPPYQSLYRRFRPQRFDEVRGQGHVTRAMANAVRDGKVSHAYLFSGPRGTGKTSTARILAKALNCADRRDSEPCGACASCVAVQSGTSLDVHELDAASNNGVEAMRDLVSRAALTTPGRWKVYIVDEVHMLSVPASNALLKTLEEPPPHVVFVLATTDPQKVLPTIRSRTQHYEFRLLGVEVLASLLRDVTDAAGLGVGPEAIDLVVRRGKGSARDALSALDQVAAAGEVEEEPPVADEVVEALCGHDPGRALVAVADGCAAGRDARRLAGEVLDHLRNGFLATMAPRLVELPDTARERVEEQARRLGPAALVRAMEALGQAQIDMREALDPRVCLETALVRVTRPDTDVAPAALLERIERLERGLSGHVTEPARTEARRAVSPPAEPAPRADRPDVARPDVARPALGSLRTRPAGTPAPSPAPGPARGGEGPSSPGDHPADHPAEPPPAEPSRAESPRSEPSGAALPTRDQLTKAWGDVVLTSLPGRSKARFGAGRFAAVEPTAAVFAVPNQHFLTRCEEVKAEVEAALAAHFGRPVPLRLTVDRPAPVPADTAPEPEEPPELHETAEPPPAVASPVDRLRQAFPGAEEVS